MKYTTFRNTSIGAVVVVIAGVVGAYELLHGRNDNPAPDVSPATATATATATSTDTKALAEDRVPWKHRVAPTPATPPTQVDAATFEHNVAGPNGLRDVDRDVLDLVKGAATGDKLKDAANGKPYKIDLHSDDGKAWNRVKIDLNRNGKWDEKWSLKDGKWHREVASADDENYDARFVLDGDAWKQK